MKKVLAGGTFNLLHPGHIFFLERARKLGEYLVVVVASDRTVLERKGPLVMDAKARKRIIECLRMVDKAVIGDDVDFMKVVRKERPDIIALGYDQEMDEEMIGRQTAGMRLRCRIVRIRSSLKGYKTRDILARSKENW